MWSACARSGRNLQQLPPNFLADNNASNRINGFDWQFNVVDDPTVNAWCMPGGKVVVYTGILPVTQNDNGL
ncbi:MAG: M48 family metalloprotease, partial [Flavobacteriales bacterium]|nr:M48 family metalloprotease [Flavobacteriales bacterium]